MLSGRKAADFGQQGEDDGKVTRDGFQENVVLKPMESNPIPIETMKTFLRGDKKKKMVKKKLAVNSDCSTQ